MGWSRVVVALMLACTVNALFAQTWPSRPVKIIVPFAAGGGPDVQTRQSPSGLAACTDS